MIFKHKPSPKHGDIRYKVFFAWLPVRIGLETRWLERVSVKQLFYKSDHDRRCSFWFNKAFEQQPLPDFKYHIGMPLKK